MAKIEGQILIGRPVEEVFDFVADSRNEPQYKPGDGWCGVAHLAAHRGGDTVPRTHGQGGHADAGGADRI
jgi:uncharacterized protein YndB with AHSA1/START domain